MQIFVGETCNPESVISMTEREEGGLFHTRKVMSQRSKVWGDKVGGTLISTYKHNDI